MDLENKSTRLNWSDLPSDVQLKIIRGGIERASSGKEAIRFLRSLGSVNQFLYKFVKDNSTFLIRLINMIYNLPKWSIAFYLGSLSGRDYKDVSMFNNYLKNDSSQENLGMAIPYEISPIKYSLHSSYYSSKKILPPGSTPEEENGNYYEGREEFNVNGNGTLSVPFSIRTVQIYEESQEEIRERDEKYCREEMQKSLIDFILAGDYENVLGLLENKVDPNFSNFSNMNGYTPLYIAICENHPKIAELLLTYLANPNWKDDIGCTPLIWASIKGMKSLVDCLVQNGAFLDIVDNFGLTALSKACLNNHLEIVETLLSSGANSQIKDNTGQTVYDHAIIEGNTKMIALLKEKGDGVHIMKGKEKVHVTVGSLSKSDGALLTPKVSKIVSTDDFWDFGEEEENDQKSEEWVENISKLISNYDLTHLLDLNDTLDKNLSDRTSKIKDMIQDRIQIILQI